MVNSDTSACFEAYYQETDAKKNKATQLTVKLD
jgi:hypothetical protein